MHIQVFGLEDAVERLYARVVGRLPRPGEVDAHSVVVRPQIHDLTSELGPIVTEEKLWSTSRQPNLIQGFRK
jgi:hypothetical protein